MLALESLVNTSADWICDKPAVLTDFNGVAYMGAWYEQQHSSGLIFEPDGSTCVEALYSNLNTADGSFNVLNSLQDANFSPRDSSPTHAYCPDVSGQCYVGLNPDSPFSSPNYTVIDTDYTSYSIVYHCGKVHLRLWLLTREPVID